MSGGPGSGPGLYVHVPFCVRKCAYCDFDSLPDAPGRPGRVRRYLEAISIELRGLPPGFRPGTLYLGGGTPTALEAGELERLLGALRRGADLGGVGEATCEANPGTLDGRKLEILRGAGVNRLSIGAQSFQAGVLARLGRSHSARQAVEAVRAARAAGFENLGLDLILGAPGAGPEDGDRDLDQALALGPEHLSIYALSLEPGTPLERDAAAGRWTGADDDRMADGYERARDRLLRAGYGHYEISSFARPGRESRHNGLYWSGGEYIGLGPSAHSHWAGARRGNVRGLDAYAGALSEGRSPAAFEERLGPFAKAVETLVFSLRRTRGVQRGELLGRTGLDPLGALRAPIQSLLGRGLLEPAPPDGVRLAPGALFISDTVFRELAQAGRAGGASTAGAGA